MRTQRLSLLRVLFLALPLTAFALPLAQMDDSMQANPDGTPYEDETPDGSATLGGLTSTTNGIPNQQVPPPPYTVTSDPGVYYPPYDPNNPDYEVDPTAYYPPYDPNEAGAEVEPVPYYPPVPSYPATVAPDQSATLGGLNSTSAGSDDDSGDLDVDTTDSDADLTDDTDVSDEDSGTKA